MGKVSLCWNSIGVLFEVQVHGHFTPACDTLHAEKHADIINVTFIS